MSGGNSLICGGYCAGGTVGFKVCDNRTAAVDGIITCNHVATAGCPNLCPNNAPLGTNFFSPGIIDDSPVCTTIGATDVGALNRFVPMVLDGVTTNYVDAAFVQSTDTLVSNTIQGLGPQNNTVVAAYLGQTVCKSGRTSGVTCGTVTGIDLTVNVDYGNACGVGRFSDAIMYSPTEPYTVMSQSGDSGAPVVDANTNAAVALNVASTQSGSGIGNPIGAILSALDVSLCGSVLPTETETVSTPVTPSGPTNGIIDMSYSFATGGSISNLGHSVQYLFDWGDGTNSGWLPVENSASSYSWASPGTYSVKAQARCATDNSVVSGWSSTLTITIVAPIALQSPSDNILADTCSLYSLPTFSWIIGETFKSYELQFSTNQSFSSIPVRVKLSTIGTQVNANTWKKVLMISGPTGGTVYWRVIGKRLDKTTFTSESRSLVIESPNGVGNPNISPTNKGSLPTLSWNNGCNIKFKVWFGNDPYFTKKKALSFNIKNPNDNGGTSARQLTSGQWTSIRKLVGDLSGSAIYWYIESWDGLKRYASSDVMNFALME